MNRNVSAFCKGKVSEQSVLIDDSFLKQQVPRPRAREEITNHVLLLLLLCVLHHHSSLSPISTAGQLEVFPIKTSEVFEYFVGFI